MLPKQCEERLVFLSFPKPRNSSDRYFREHSEPVSEWRWCLFLKTKLVFYIMSFLNQLTLSCDCFAQASESPCCFRGINCRLTEDSGRFSGSELFLSLFSLENQNWFRKFLPLFSVPFCCAAFGLFSFISTLKWILQIVDIAHRLCSTYRHSSFIRTQIRSAWP